MTVIGIARTSAWPTLQAAPGVTLLDEAAWRRHGADLHLVIIDDEGRVGARCSCWWSERPPLEQERVGVIGHYAAAATEDAASGGGALAARLLREACARLAAEGCTLAVGPMDGNTWRSYRLVTERGPEPPFFLEPDTPPAWTAQFTDAGFAPLATYTSALARDLTRRDERLAALAARLQRGGVSIRPLDRTRAEEELRRIHALSLVSFRDNVLYTPLDEAEFLEQNQRLLPFVRPELVLLAERPGSAPEQPRDLVGFLFAVPDVLQQRRAQAIDTVIIKTVAVRPGLTNAGLGSLLVAEVQQRAAALGYTRAIHALMHEQNVSRNISRRYAETIRRYTLFAKRLAPPAPSEPNPG
jgi:GNAT superfamily N-acetyltransferase